MITINGSGSEITLSLCRGAPSPRQCFRSHLFNVYLCPVTGGDCPLLPEERRAEVDGTGNAELKKQKTTSWKLLERGIAHAFGYRMDELKFSRSAHGKWTCDKLYFSISHTADYVAVAVSDLPAGVDMESVMNFCARWKEDKALQRLAEKILCAGETGEDMLALWLKKESAYKMKGTGAFRPQTVDTQNERYLLCEYRGNALAVCGERLPYIRFFEAEGENTVPLCIKPRPVSAQ